LPGREERDETDHPDSFAILKEEKRRRRRERPKLQQKHIRRLRCGLSQELSQNKRIKSNAQIVDASQPETDTITRTDRNGNAMSRKNK
jgi:hypothetical protein